MEGPWESTLELNSLHKVLCASQPRWAGTWWNAGWVHRSDAERVLRWQLSVYMMSLEDFRASKSFQLSCGERPGGFQQGKHCELDCVSWKGDVVPWPPLLCFPEVDCIPLLGQREHGRF